jgi:hypothetical protein
MEVRIAEAKGTFALRKEEKPAGLVLLGRPVFQELKQRGKGESSRGFFFFETVLRDVLHFCGPIFPSRTIVDS